MTWVNRAIIVGWTWIAFLLLAGCAEPSRPLPTRPTGTCDVRMVDHNRRACAELSKTFTEPGAGHPCGVCR